MTPIAAPHPIARNGQGAAISLDEVKFPVEEACAATSLGANRNRDARGGGLFVGVARSAFWKASCQQPFVFCSLFFVLCSLFFVLCSLFFGKIRGFSVVQCRESYSCFDFLSDRKFTDIFVYLFFPPSLFQRDFFASVAKQLNRHALCNPLAIHIIPTFDRSPPPFPPSFEGLHAV